jgi:peptidyl-prolyl cis-trans isomerase D
MFQFFRRQDKLVRWFLGSLLVLICLTMLTYLVPGINNAASDDGASSTVLGKACGEPVTSADVVQQFESLNKQQQRPLPATFLAIYAPQILKSQLEEKVLDCEAHRMGLEVTGEEIADRLRSSSGFFPGGEFIGADRYREIVEQQMGMTVETFENEIRQEILRGKIRHIVTDAIEASDREIDSEYHHQNDKVKVDYVILKADDLSKDVKLDPEREKAFFERTKPNYQVPERRQLKYAVLDMNRVREAINVTPAELQAYYDRNRDTYRVKERVHLAQIMVETDKLPADKIKDAEKKINDTLAKVRKGGDFAEIAKTDSEDAQSAAKGGDLGWTTREQIASPEMATAAFTLPAGQISDVIKSKFGLHIIKVLEHEQAHQKALAEVQAEILTKVKAEKAERAQQQVLDQLDAALRKNPKGLDAVAASMGMIVLGDPGHQRNAPLPLLGVSPAADEAIFALKVGEVSGLVTVGEQKALFQLVAIQPSHDPAFEEVKARVDADFKVAEADNLVTTRSQEFADRLKAVGDLTKAAKEKKYEVKSSTEMPVTGRIDDFGNAPDFPAQAFKMKPGEFGGPLKSGRNTMFFQVTSLVVPNAVETAANRDKVRVQVTEEKRNAYFSVYLDQLRDRMTKDGKMTTNEAAMKRFTSLYQQ